MRLARIAAVVASTAATVTVLAAPATADHSWGTYHWARTSNPFTLVVADNVSADWDAYLDRSISEWSQSSVLDLVETAGTNNPKRCNPTAGRVEVCNAAYGRNGWLGLASINITGGTHITAGTTKVNDTYFTMPQYNTLDERAHVMCQEIGHDFGLGHTSEDGSSQQTCMDYSTDPNSTSPNAHDYAQLESIYTHLDSTSTVGATSPSKLPRVGEDASTWGKLIHTSKDGRHATYVRNFGGGNAVVTEVTWAD